MSEYLIIWFVWLCIAGSGYCANLPSRSMFGLSWHQIFCALVQHMSSQKTITIQPGNIRPHGRITSSLRMCLVVVCVWLSLLIRFCYVVLCSICSCAPAHSLWNPLKPIKWSVLDRTCPITQVGTVFNAVNVWANIQGVTVVAYIELTF